MSQSIPAEPRIQDIIDAVRGPYKCRIPQRMHSERQPQSKSRSNNADVMFRTKSTSRAASTKETSSQIHDTSRSIRSSSYGEKNSSTVKKYPATAKRNTVDQKKKVGRPVITVPVQQKVIKTLCPVKNCRTLPDQNIINRYEELEVQQSDPSNDTFEYTDLTESGEMKPENEKIGDINSDCQISNNEFQKIKIELKKRQETVEAGNHTNQSSTDDFYTMNVAVTAYDGRRSKLCSESKHGIKDTPAAIDSGFPLDVLKFYNMPSKLVATCERALAKRQEIIDWLDSLKTKVSNNSLAKKVNDFNSENEILRATLANVRNEFIKELQVIENYIRERVNDTMAMHLQAENMTYKLSELNEQNANLRKQLSNAQNCKTYLNRSRIWELEKDSKEKHRILRERLAKTEGQVRTITEQACQLESTLEKMNIKLESKEEKITELQEQNLILQKKYDEELKGLHESIQESTRNLELIEQARDKLQAEKDQLEKQLIQTTQNYNESLNKNAIEMKLNREILKETETKYNIELEERNKLKSRYGKQLEETEIRNKDLEKKIQEIENQINNTMVLKVDHEEVREELERAHLDINNYKHLLFQDTVKIKNIEHNMKETKEENGNLKENLDKNQKYILDLKCQEDLLQSRLHDSEAKIESYQNQILELKNTLEQMQEQINIDDIKSLREKITKQETELVTANIDKNKLSDSIKNKEIELIHLLEVNKYQEHNLREKDDVIKSLSRVEEEQSDVIKQLRNDLEHRSTGDAETVRQLEQRNFEITTLSNNLSIRNDQILQLEKIILTLEDKARKASLHQKNYEDTIHLLEMKIQIYESHYYKQGVEATSRNLDHFLKLLEDEMANPSDSNDRRHQTCTEASRKIMDESSCSDNLHDHECYERQFENPTKQKPAHKDISLHESSIKTTCPSCNDEFFKEDNGKKSNSSPLDKSNSYVIHRKQNTAPKCKPNEENSREKMLTKKLQLLGLNKHELEKRSKMFALAGHRL